jgi:hypothetical protein
MKDKKNEVHPSNRNTGKRNVALSVSIDCEDLKSRLKQHKINLTAYIIACITLCLS